MEAIDREFLGMKTVGDTQKYLYRVTIIANTKPATMPTDGTNVGMRSTEVFAPGSCMFFCDTQKVAIVNASGTWVTKE